MKTIKCKNNYGEDVELPLERFRQRPSVYGVFRKSDCILVCRTKSNGKLWMPGGGVEQGETHEEALRREVMEEAGIKDFRIKKLIADFRNYCYYAPEDDACDAHLFFYECETDQRKFKLNDEIEDGEAIDFSWMELSQIFEDEFCDANEKIQDMLKRFE
jgi:8-oxo-dGTP diphosphatase